MPVTVPMKCLLVDDDQCMLEILSRTVEMLGFEPITACDGDEGFSAFCECHPDLVVSDIHMPNRNGLLLLHDIKTQCPEIPVILITGYIHYKAVLNLDAGSPDAFVEKPFTLDQLREAIEKVLPAIRANLIHRK
jgi:two-component system, OmpR family, response regulator RpaB